MNTANPQELGLLAKLILILAIGLVAAGLCWRGATFQAVQRLWANLADRPGGLMSFRFILQPAMAALIAVRDGRKDARTGRSPYFWTVLRDRRERIPRLREGLNATARVILFGLGMDVIYQAIALHAFYPVEALIVALVLAFVPYLLIRGPVARLSRGRATSGKTR